VIDVSEDDTDVGTVAAVLADDCARDILEATVTQPMSAARLGEHCDVSEPTVYRKLEALRDLDLIESRTRLDEDGHHHDVYTATLDRAVVELTEDGFRVRVTRRERMADRFTRFVEEMRR
jgi:predicted transcriptional regulator